MKEILKITLFSILGGVLSLVGYTTLIEKETKRDENKDTTLKNHAIPVANYTRNTSILAENIDFTTAAEKTIHAVVHVTNTTSYKQPRSILSTTTTKENKYKKDQQALA
jgi:hypothetical protein